MNSTVIKTDSDFIVLQNANIRDKFFIYDFEKKEYLMNCKTFMPIPFSSRYEALSFCDADEIVKTFDQLPTYLKIALASWR